MSTLRHRLVVPLAIIMAVTLAPALTGCIGNPIQGIVKAATGGKVDTGGAPGTLPSDFPKDVPIATGKIITSIGVGSGAKKVWNVTVTVTGSNPGDSIMSALKSAGFKVEPLSASAGKETALAIIASSSTHSVIIGISKVKSDWSVNYTVGPADSK